MPELDLEVPEGPPRARGRLGDRPALCDAREGAAVAARDRALEGPLGPLGVPAPVEGAAVGGQREELAHGPGARAGVDVLLGRIRRARRPGPRSTEDLARVILDQRLELGDRLGPARGRDVLLRLGGAGARGLGVVELEEVRVRPLVVLGARGGAAAKAHSAVSSAAHIPPVRARGISRSAAGAVLWLMRSSMGRSRVGTGGRGGAEEERAGRRSRKRGAGERSAAG